MGIPPRLDSLPVLTGVPAVSAAQMAEVDRAAIEEHGIAIEMLMENASYQIARAARLLLGDLAGRRVVCLSGTGNNGGDAIGAARRLRGWGADARCILASAVLHATARLQREIAIRSGVSVLSLEEAELGGADLIIDGLLGYSISGPPRGGVERLIALANAAAVPVLAVDLPSGLDPDRGVPLGAAIRAAWTVTLALPKTGLLAEASRELVGELLLADIGIPAAVYDRFGMDTRRLFAAGDLLHIAR